MLKRESESIQVLFCPFTRFFVHWSSPTFVCSLQHVTAAGTTTIKNVTSTLLRHETGRQRPTHAPTNTRENSSASSLSRSRKVSITGLESVPKRVVQRSGCGLDCARQSKMLGFSWFWILLGSDYDHDRQLNDRVFIFLSNAEHVIGFLPTMAKESGPVTCVFKQDERMNVWPLLLACSLYAT